MLGSMLDGMSSSGRVISIMGSSKGGMSGREGIWLGSWLGNGLRGRKCRMLGRSFRFCSRRGCKVVNRWVKRNWGSRVVRLIGCIWGSRVVVKVRNSRRCRNSV